MLRRLSRYSEARYISVLRRNSCTPALHAEGRFSPFHRSSRRYSREATGVSNLHGRTKPLLGQCRVLEGKPHDLSQFSLLRKSVKRLAQERVIVWPVCPEIPEGCIRNQTCTDYLRMPASGSSYAAKRSTSPVEKRRDASHSPH